MPVMATSVELTFDPELTERIQNIWGTFTSANIECARHPTHALPHISLAIRELCSDDQRTLFERLANQLAQFTVRFDATGMFLRPLGLNYPDDTVVLFLSPKPTVTLLEANRLAAQELHGWNEGRWNHYRPERWIPHCTLAEHLVQRDIPKALQICTDKLGRPIAGSITGMRLINFGGGEIEVLVSQAFPART